MYPRFSLRHLFFLLSVASVASYANQSNAAAFQVFEQDAVSIGNYHAGRTAEISDASTAYYNPAGLIRFKNQQMVIGGATFFKDIRYRGTIDVVTNAAGDPVMGGPQAVDQQGGSYRFVPFFHYVSPVCDCISYGMSIVEPFGFKTNYSNSSLLRYATTKSFLRVIDVSPALGFAINSQWSVGIGLNVQFLNGEFDRVARGDGVAISDLSGDTPSINSGKDHGYGYHVGVLYQPNPCMRYGASYQSRILHNLNGKSKFAGPLAEDNTDGTQTSYNLSARIILPPITTVSAFHSFNPCWDVMGTITYTQWNALNHLLLQNVAGLDSNSLTFPIQQEYRNAWNYSVGANFHPYDCLTLRAGVGYDQSPQSNSSRRLPLADSDRVAVAIGGHYQWNQTWGFDAGWTHLFMINSRIDNVPLEIGSERNITSGSMRSGEDIYGFQVRWDVA